jgi:hypothetical protein
MMKITKKTSVEGLAAIITKALNKQSISAVLTGGAVVSIYTENEYASKDLDFISPSDQKLLLLWLKLVSALKEKISILTKPILPLNFQLGLYHWEIENLSKQKERRR